MPDNVDIDPGTTPSVPVSTDEAGDGSHVQLMKLALSADGSRVHATVDADGVLVNLGANNDVTVSGVSTAANQTTVIGHVDGIETLLGTIDADTSALVVDAAAIEALLTTIDADTGNLAGILTAVQIIDNIVSGSEAQVDVVAALPAGTNNIGDVDVLTMPKSATSTAISLASAATSAQVIAANANRLALTLTNTDANGVYVNVGNTASATEFTVFIPGTGAVATDTFAYWEMPQPVNTEAIHAIWTSNGSGSLIGTELAV
jgi:hypothetical protein